MGKTEVAPVTPLELTQQVRDVSVTERGSFRTCRRRWHLEVIENLTPKAPAWALEFGTGIHNALEAYYVNDSSVAHAHEAMCEWYEEVDERVSTELGGLYTEEAAQEILDMRNLGVDMLTRYPQFERDTKTKWSKVVAVEGHGMDTFKNKRPAGYPKEADVIVHPSGRCMVPIVNPHTKAPIRNDDNELVYLTARIDMIVERARPFTGLWVVDHKTTASAPNDRGLDFDDQTTGYSYVLWRLTGKMPRGVIFNYLVKQAPKEPRWIQGNKKNGPHNADGKALSTAKDMLTTPDMYRDALKSVGLYKGGKVLSPDHAACLDALLSKGYDPFFQRFEPRRNENEIMAYEGQVFYQQADMVEAADMEEFRYPNKSTWWCPSCSMNRICQAMDDGSDVEDVIEHSYMQGEDRKAL